MSPHNPLLPDAYDVAWTVFTVLLIAFTVTALISLIRRAHRLSSMKAMVWAAVIIAAPGLGPAAWFGVGRRSPAERSEEG